MNDITFQAVLQSERKRLGWTRNKMSEETGIPSRTIKSWETGTEPPVYIKRYVLADLREKGRSSSKFFDMINVLRECDEYLESLSGCNYIGTGSRLHQNIKVVLDD